MEMYVGVTALCIVSGMLAAVMHKRLADNDKLCIKNIYFYGIISYGIMSFVKMLLGFGERTLFSSFNKIERGTYLHYGLPLIIISLILPVVIRGVWGKDNRNVFLKYFGSIFSFIAGILFLGTGVITNYHCVIICICSLIFSVIVLFVNRGNAEFHEKEKKKEKVQFILPIILLWTITVLIFEPNQLLLHNLEEFSIPYFDFFSIMLVESAVMTVIYVLIGVYVLSDWQLKAFGTIIFGVSVAGYIQGNFLNGEMLVMDGTVQVWSSSQKVINGIVWLVIIAAAVFLNYNVRYKNICRKIVQGVCIYICLIQILSLTFMIITTRFPDEENEFVLTTNHMLELDADNNVVVFVLDYFDRQIMDDILEQDPKFVKELKDFTDYTDTTSCYAYTALSIPYLLTGVAWEYGMQAADYCEYAYENSSFLSDIENQNYSMGIYTGSAYIGNFVKNRLLNYSNDITKTLGYKKAFYVMNSTSKYKMAPFAAKQFYFYTTDDIAEIVVNDGEYSINNDIIFHNELQKNKLSIDTSDNYAGAFRFYHLKGAHPLFTMNEEFEEVKENGTQLSQSRGALKIVYEYINEMKKLGVYDNATIIITADHGQNRSVMRESYLDTDYDMTSTPILFVKLPNEQHEKKPVSSIAPVSHTEFGATVMEAIGGDAQKYGRTFSQIGLHENRERMFTYVVPPEKNYRRYIINGNSNDPISWRELED